MFTVFIMIVTYFIGLIATAAFYSNFWPTRTQYRMIPNEFEIPFMIGSLLWPLGLPLMIACAIFEIISNHTPEPGWIGRGLSRVISQRKSLEKKIESQQEYIDTLEEKFRELERKDGYK